MGPSTHPVPTRLGPYQLVRRIATGGMAEVYLARREGPHGFEKFVAVKRILPQFVRDPDFVAMFVDEARVCARLAHPSIVQVFDFGEHDGDLYMAMEYIDGTTGAKLVRAAASRGEEIPLDVTLQVILSVLRGLEYAHTARDDNGRALNLVHRDVSPGNVLIDRSGAVKLTDFGIARAAEFERRTDAGQLKGKLGYMSPEQVVGRELDARSDLFTLAIVFAELVTLRPLFSGGRELDVLIRIRDADLSAIDATEHRVPDDVRQVLYRALERDPLLRYPSAAAFAEAIEEIVRRRRLQVGPSKLAGFIERLGLVDAVDDEAETDETGRRSTAVLENPMGSAKPATESAPPAPTSGDVCPPIYKVQLPDGTVVGPMSFPRIVEMFVLGRLPDGALVARESGRFRPAREYPELHRFVSSPAMRWEDGWPRDTTERKPVDRVLLPQRLFRYAAMQETGALFFRDGTRRKKIYIVDGVPEYIASTDKNELLGEFLVKRGQVLRMEVDMALALLPRFKGSLGDALVGLSVLRPIELFRAVLEQTQMRYAEVLSWRRGEMGFVRGARSHEETFPFNVSPFELLARGVREGYSARELSAILSPMEEFLLEPVRYPEVRIDDFRLTDRDMRIIRSVTDSIRLDRFLTQQVATQKVSSEDVYFAVFFGLSCGFLVSHRWDCFTAESMGAIPGRPSG